MAKRCASACASGLAIAISLMLAAQAQQPSSPMANRLAPIATASPTDAAAEPTHTPEEIAGAKKALMATIHPKTGKVEIAKGKATLNVPPEFIYLDPHDAERMLSKAWGKLPSQLREGMIMAAGSTPFDARALGGVIEYEESGDVSDQDAAKINYDDLIADRRSQQEAENPQRAAQHYPEINIVGWAAKPRDDAACHKLDWAKELAFKGEPEHTLNFDMRVLGCTGVLSPNFIAGKYDLPAIEAAGLKVMAFTDFNAGWRYQDFGKKNDKEARFDLVGLIAGGAVAAGVTATNTGPLALALVFLKKGAVAPSAGAIAAGGPVMRFFKGRDKKPPAI